MKKEVWVGHALRPAGKGGSRRPAGCGQTVFLPPGWVQLIIEIQKAPLLVGGCAPLHPHTNVPDQPWPRSAVHKEGVEKLR